ncbi:MAG: endonuclease/exonuclease/phosphatase family protein [Nitrospiraceae bacterium]|nr:endonuclease/exonuclease/phosphatase family protein [Nitrospiraceae bacterium]
MDTANIVSAVISFLRPFLPYLLQESKPLEEREIDAINWELAEAIWARIRPKVEANPAIKETIHDVTTTNYEEDALAALRFQLKKLLSDDSELAGELSNLWTEAITSGVVVDNELTAEKRLDVLGHDDVLKGLEMIRLLRTGMPLDQVAKEFNTSVEHLYRLNAAFSLNGVFGILSGSDIRNWFDRVSKEDPIIRRLEMIRLLRSGTPVEVIAKQYDAVPEYIYRLDKRFSRDGVIGILTEEDFQKFRSIYPEVIRICSYNLHGTHLNDLFRFRRIAREMSAFDPDLCAFQEVISGNGIEETSAQIAKWMTRMTGCYYQTRYAYCHPFKDKYPEGLSVSAKHQLKNTRIIDLNSGLRDGLVPGLERYAVAIEVKIYGRRIIFVSVHFDHENPKIRLAQAEKLLRELDSLYKRKDYYSCILAGDFNDVEDSPVMDFLRKNGYKDAYRHCHPTGGNTFDAVTPYKRIDYIMVKGNVNFLSAELVLKDPKLSDHIGVLAVIK